MSPRSRTALVHARVRLDLADPKQIAVSGDASSRESLSVRSVRDPLTGLAKRSHEHCGLYALAQPRDVLPSNVRPSRGLPRRRTAPQRGSPLQVATFIST